MGKYEEKLSEVVNAPGFKRLFHGECKKCGKQIWSVGEEIDVEQGVIKALFICNCGAKYKQTVYSRENPKKGYRYTQGLVTDTTIQGKKRRIIQTLDSMYLVTPEGIKVKKKKK